MKENKNLPVLGTYKVFKPIKDSENRLDIRRICFTDKIPNLDSFENKWDVSDAQNGSIIAWLDGDILYISGNGVILANENCEELFRGFNMLKIIKFNDLFDTSNMKNTRWMFQECKRLESVDVSNWNTKNLENALCMFRGCYHLESLDVSNWDTQNLKDANFMFENCESLESLDLTNWNTRNLKEAWGMFYDCWRLKKLDLSKWNTQNLQNTKDMFTGCLNLRMLDLSKWNTQNLKYFDDMFFDCDSLERVDTNSYDIYIQFYMCRQAQCDKQYGVLY